MVDAEAKLTQVPFSKSAKTARLPTCNADFKVSGIGVDADVRLPQAANFR